METITEKTIKKLNLKPIKEFFKKEEEKQRFYKNARKNAKFSYNKDGKMIWDPMHPSEAQSRVYWNSIELRKFYGAYALLRGKKLSQVEQNYREDDPNHFFNKRKLLMEKILEGFKSMSEIKE